MKTIWTLLWAIFSINTAFAKPAAGGRAEADSLCRAGMVLLEAGKVSEAAEAFRAASGKDSRYALPYIRLGTCLLRQDSLGAAERAFDTALGRDSKSVEALNGLGLVCSRLPKQSLRAIDYFHRAVVIDRGYVEAWYNMAMAHLRMRNRDALGAFEDVLKVDPNHPDAWFRMGTIQESREDYPKAAQAFEGQLSTHPHHEGARYRLGKMYRLLGENSKALEILSAVADSGAFARGATLEVAQVYQQQGQYGNAQEAFESYIGKLSPGERGVYRDLSRVLSGPAQQAYLRLPPDQKEAAFDRYWVRQDPAPLTEANERLVEHYRRVAHAREDFSGKADPWDARGDTYVRYGAPDHISRYNDIRMETDPGVVAVKQRLMAQAGPYLGAILPRREAENSGEGPSRTQVETADPKGLPVFPVRGTAAWEYWIYARVAGGIEVVFTKDQEGAPYQLASVPPEMIGLRSGLRWMEMAPIRVVEGAASQTPEAYRPDFAAGGALDFYTYAASFRGTGGKSRLEVYTGVPAAALTYAPMRGDSVGAIERGIALYDSAGVEVCRGSDQAFNRRPAIGSEGALIPGVTSVETPPGTYEMAVQVRDPRSNRTQVYRWMVPVGDYGGTPLLLSDLEVGIAPAGGRAPEVFVKSGYPVIPMASLAFRKGQPVAVYYEVYNLNLERGSSAYRVAYTVRSPEKKGVGAKVLSGIGKLLGVANQATEVSIAYDMTGTKAQEAGYLELSLDESETGRQELTVVVTDSHTGRTATKSISFKVDTR